MNMSAHVLVAWVSFALLMLFALRYGMGKRDCKYYGFGLLIGFALTAGSANRALLMMDGWRIVSTVVTAIMAVALVVVLYGTLIEWAESKRDVRFSRGAELIGNFSPVLMGGMLLSLILLTIAVFCSGGGNLFLYCDKRA